MHRGKVAMNLSPTEDQHANDHLWHALQLWSHWSSHVAPHMSQDPHEFTEAQTNQTEATQLRRCQGILQDSRLQVLWTITLLEKMHFASFPHSPLFMDRDRSSKKLLLQVVYPPWAPTAGAQPDAKTSTLSPTHLASSRTLELQRD